MLPLSKRNLVANHSSQAKKPQLKQPHGRPNKSSLAITALRLRIPNRIRNPTHTPPNAQKRARDRIQQPGDKQRDHDRSMVLEKVSVRPLRAVPEVQRVLLLGGC